MSDTTPTPPSSESQQNTAPVNPVTSEEHNDCASNTSQSPSQPSNPTVSDNQMDPTTIQEQKKTNGWALASLIFGIISLALVIFAPIALPAAILALVFAFVARKQEKSAMSTAGLITGSIGLGLTIIITAFGIFFVGHAVNAMLDYVDSDSEIISIIEDDEVEAECVDAVVENMQSLNNPDNNIVDNVSDIIDDEILNLTGMSLDDMDIDEEDFAAWLFNDFSYIIDEVTLYSDNTAIVTISLESKDFEAFSTELSDCIHSLTNSKEFDSMTEDELKDEAHALAKHLMRDFDSEAPCVMQFDLWLYQDGNGEWNVENLEASLGEFIYVQQDI